MKKTDLEKNKALKLVGKMKSSAASGRPFGSADAPALDRREQRKLDQAQGLVSFPLKIQQTLADEIRELSVARNQSVNDVVGELLQRALKARDGDADLG